MSTVRKAARGNAVFEVEAIQAREPKVVTRLVETYTEQLFRASLGLGFDQTTSRELVQNLWVTFFEAAPTFKGTAHIRTYLFGILYNKASELRRDHQRFDAPDPVEKILDERFDQKGHWIKPPVDPEAFLGGTQTLDLIRKCLDALPTAQRMAFTLKEIEDEKSPDICKILSVSVTNLGVLLYRARNRLRECVESKVSR